ncbi:MAG: DUF86 domain-containing protein [Solirubrobacterales bacterium]|nr:DUF86 domain-containing protein [Solirubrobacterales bacterium]
MKSQHVYLEHLLDAIDRVLEYTQPGEAQFRTDLKTQDAVLRNLETLGEAAKKLDDETRALSSEAPWREITGFRDVIAHDYLEVDLDLVWNVVESDLPHLRKTILGLLDQVDT